MYSLLTIAAALLITLSASISQATKVQLPAETPPKSNFDQTHELWTEILEAATKVAGKQRQLNYAGVDAKKVAMYVGRGLNVRYRDFKTWSREQKLAFFINLYNALVVKRVLDHYPGVRSMKELGSGLPLFRSAWQVPFFTLFAEESSLDHIEHVLVRKNPEFGDARIHFAFSCGARGCPSLQKQAFVADKLDQQLEAAKVEFLKDRKRVSFDAGRKVLSVSKIFEWYGNDFNKHPSLKDFFIAHADLFTEDKSQAKVLKSGDFSIEYKKFDWTLNDSSIK